MRSWLPRMGAGVAGTGLLLVVTGTFLDWSRSGSVLRNSYESVAILRRLDLLDGSPLEWLVDAWLLVAPVAALAVAVYALRARKSAAALTSLLSIMTGTISGFACVQAGGKDTMVGLASTGPMITFIGSVLALAGSVVVLTTGRASATRTPGGVS